MSDIVYLDVGCFRRPFDDATQQRVRREAEAVAAILDAAKLGSVRLVRSPAHDVLKRARDQREHIHVQVLVPDEVPLPAPGETA